MSNPWIVDYAWKLGKPCMVKNMEVVKKIAADYYTEVEIHKCVNYTEEIREKELNCQRYETEIYEFEELQSLNQDSYCLSIRGEFKLTIYGSTYSWIERLLKERYNSVYLDAHIDYNLTYRKLTLKEILFEFYGYSKACHEKERISLQSQFEHIKAQPDLQEGFGYSFGEVPKLKRFFPDS